MHIIHSSIPLLTDKHQKTKKRENREQKNSAKNKTKTKKCFIIIERILNTLFLILLTHTHTQNKTKKRIRINKVKRVNVP